MVIKRFFSMSNQPTPIHIQQMRQQQFRLAALNINLLKEFSGRQSSAIAASKSA